MTCSAAYTSHVPASLTGKGLQGGFRVIEGGAAHRASDTTAITPRDHRRMFAFALAIVAALGLFWCHIDRVSHEQVTQRLAHTATEVITVMPGDSLWVIAEAHPVYGCTTSQVAHHIRSANGLTTSALKTGMQLVVPQEALSS